jgi:hypothetical protein
MQNPRILFGTPSPAFGSRRQFLHRAGAGCGLIALSSLLQQQDLSAESSTASVDVGNSMRPKQPHFPAKAKSVIWLFMNGGQSQVDTYDYKPALEKHHGKTFEGLDPKMAFFQKSIGNLLKSPFQFKQHGESGTWMSEIFPNLSAHADELAFVHSCHTETNNHTPALFMINSGFTRQGFPSVGSWITYGLGSETQSLPAFVVMTDTLGRGLPKGLGQSWGAGLLPGVFQGTALDFQGEPIKNLVRRQKMTDAQQRSQLDLFRELNQSFLAEAGEPELKARIESFETAYQMQMAAPEALDVDREPDHIHKLYGMDQKHCSHFARQCLMARRLVERGVRIVQIYSGGEENQNSWDGHIDIEGNHGQFGMETDQPIAALLSDLRQRGLLDSTLVINCGEFGRLPVAQILGKAGRDHNPRAFTTWFAGAGVRGGAHYGETDELGYEAAVDKVSVHDLHATILHLLGFDHERLTFRFNGRDVRLTDVEGRVVSDILA